MDSPTNKRVLTEESAEIGECQVCGVKTELCCERCRSVFYCSPEHQREDWKQHRDTCEQFPSSSAMVKVEDIRLQADADIAESEGAGEADVEVPTEFTIKPAPTTVEQTQDYLLKEKAKAKDMALRAANMKKMMQSRNNERQATLYYFFKKNSQSAIITGKRVMLMSRRIFGEFNDAVLCDELEERFLIRTNKLLQEIEIVMDIAILAKIHLSMEKPEEIKHLLGPLNFQCPTLRPNPRPNISPMSSKKEMIEYNIWREEVSKLSASLCTLILITSNTRLFDITNGLFEKYRTVAQKYMTDLEVGTVEFQWGSYLQNSGQAEKALHHLLECCKIRERYGQTLALSDVLYNLGLTEFYVNQKDKSLAIDYVKRALRIRKDRLQQPSMDFHPLLETLGKFSMEVEDFWQAYRYFYQSLHICRSFLDPKDKMRKRSEVLMIFLYRTLHKRIAALPSHSSELSELTGLVAHMEVQVFMLSEFENYLLHESKKEEAHLHLDIPRDFFDMLTSEETTELAFIQEAIKNFNFRQGVEHVVKSNFYTAMASDKRAYFLSLNPKIDPLSVVIKKIMGV